MNQSSYTEEKPQQEEEVDFVKAIGAVQSVKKSRRHVYQKTKPKPYLLNIKQQDQSIKQHYITYSE